MSTNQLIFDSGTILLPAPFALPFQLGPNLDVRKYSKIRILAKDFEPAAKAVGIVLMAREGSVAVELGERLLLGGGAHHTTHVYDVPGRELQIFIVEIGGPKKLQLLLFGLED
jgi:hypothetical protein